MQSSPSYLSFAKQCRLKPGETIYLSANITRLALHAKKNKERFLPDDFIRSFTEAIGPEGTLLIPTFNHHLKKNDVFDYLKTKPETGILAQAALIMPGFKRTYHPMHSFAVWGKNQDAICKLNNKTSFGMDSPFAFLHQNNANMLIIDLDLQSSLTFAHYIEETEKVKYRKWKTIPINYTEENAKQTKTVFHQYIKKPGFINNVNPMLEIFLKYGVAEKFTVDQIPVIKIDLPNAYSLIQSDIHNNNAKNIVYFSYKNWIKDVIKLILRRS